jgi:hypothetical protein
MKWDAHHLLLADAETIAKIVLAVLGMIIWAVSHLFGDKAKAKPPAPRPRPQAPPRPPGVGPAAGGQPSTLEETLRREVEEFMRRAQGREPAAQQRSPQPRPPQQPRNPQKGQGRQQQPPAKKAVASQTRTPPRRLTDAPGSQPSPLTIEAGRGALAGASVAAHVTEHLAGAQTLAAHAQKLGADVAQADERLQEHLQQKFTHQLGALEQRAVVPIVHATRSVVAQDLFALLSKPSGMRQLVLASEILRRPEDRWERRVGGAHTDASQRG